MNKLKFTLSAFFVCTSVFSTSLMPEYEFEQVNNFHGSRNFAVTNINENELLKQHKTFKHEDNQSNQKNIKYLDNEIAEIKSKIIKLKNCYLDNQDLHPDNIYFDIYESMIKELNKIRNNVLTNLSTTNQSKIESEVEKIYQKYFPQDDE